MDLEEYADAINATLVIVRLDNQGNKYLVKFENSHLQNGPVNEYISGTGNNVHEAILSYIKQIQGKNLVISKKGSEYSFKVPDKILSVYLGSC